MGALAIDTTAFAWSGDTWSAASTSVASPLTINGSVTSNTWRPVAFASTRMHPIMPRAWGVGETEAAAGSPMPCQRRTSKRRIQASCDGGPGRGVRGTTRSAGRRWRDNARRAEALEPAHGQFGTAWRWRQRRAQRCGEGRNHRARTRPGRTHGGEHGIGGGRGRLWAHNLDRGGRGRHHTPPTGACRGQSTVAGPPRAELVSWPKAVVGGTVWRQARACAHEKESTETVRHGRVQWAGTRGAHLVAVEAGPSNQRRMLIR